MLRFIIGIVLSLVLTGDTPQQHPQHAQAPAVQHRSIKPSTITVHRNAGV